MSTNPGRIYNYWLGGMQYTQSDVVAAQQIQQIWPEAPQVTQANRAFLQRTVRWLVEQGIDQFLSIGAGIPSAGNVHTIAQQVNPDVGVVYIDHDPMVIAESQALVAPWPRVVAQHGDLTNLDALLEQEQVCAILDVTRPMAVLCVALLHFILDDTQATQALTALRRHCVRGSYLVLSHGYLPDDECAYEQVQRIQAVYQGQLARRTLPHIQSLFAGYHLVAPGLVPIAAWHPELPTPCPMADIPFMVGGVGKLT